MPKAAEEGIAATCSPIATTASDDQNVTIATIGQAFGAQRLFARVRDFERA
jgi:Trk K+ transport system NAD-binding subunit